MKRNLRYAFVVRLWRVQDEHTNGFRGSIQMAESDNIRYFASFAELNALLKEHAQLSPPSAEHLLTDTANNTNNPPEE
jgi:hypothetical protein